MKTKAKFYSHLYVSDVYLEGTFSSPHRLISHLVTSSDFIGCGFLAEWQIFVFLL